MQQVLCQMWEESERGWGTRPDGFSLHVDQVAVNAFIKAYWAEMPDGPAPDEYSRPLGNPFLVEVDDEKYKQVIESTCGIRSYDNCALLHRISLVTKP